MSQSNSTRKIDQVKASKNFFSNPKIPKERKQEFLKIHKARNNFLDFITFTKPDYKVNWHHKLICDVLDSFLKDPERQFLMLFTPPRRGKSEIISRRLPAYAFGKYPDISIIATAYGSELASAMNRDVQRIIDSDAYRKIFPNTYLNSKNVKSTSRGTYIRTSDKFEIVGRKGVYRSAGVNEGITGMGADIAIIDDPVKNFEDAMSIVKQEAAYNWYQSTLFTRLQGMKKVIMVLTRWAPGDLAGRILEDAEKNPEAPQWEVISLPEEFDPNNPDVHPEDIRTEAGELLWPEMFDRKTVNQQKHSVGTKVWESLYQQRPTPGDGTIFKTTWFQYYKELPQFDSIRASVDCSFTDTAKADYVAITVWGIAGANKYLIHLVRDRLDFGGTITELLRLKIMFPNCEKIIIENKANGPAVISTLKSKIPGIVAYTPKESKVARATAVSPQFEAGNVFIPDPYYQKNREERPWCFTPVNKQTTILLQDYIKEFQTFPHGTNDDMVDSTVQFLLDGGTSTKWFDDLLNQPSNDITNQIGKYEQNLSDIMGWNLENRPQKQLFENEEQIMEYIRRG